MLNSASTQVRNLHNGTFAVGLVGLLCAVIAACGGSASTDGGLDGSDGNACSANGAASVVITVAGLPAMVLANVEVVGPGAPQTVTQSRALSGLPTGTYTVRALRVTDADPLVRTLYVPTVSVGDSAFCLSDGVVRTITVTYAAVPSSNKLWTGNGSGGSARLLAFASSTLRASGTPAATVAAQSPAGSEVAFDRDGNLWSQGGTTADPTLVRFPSAILGTSGTKAWDVGITVPSIACIPTVRAIAFDRNGNLWLSACGGRVVQLGASQLAVTGDVTPAIVLTGLTANEDLAFDTGGNLWMAVAGLLERRDVAHLAASGAPPADRTLTCRNSTNSQMLSATSLAFDRSGNLWGVDFGSNTFFQVRASDLAGTGSATVTAAVSIVVDVLAVLDRPAFDDAGGLWFAYRAGRIARLSPAQLMTSVPAGSAPTPEVVLTSPDIGSAKSVAFFPAAAGLPLYHSVP